MKEKRNLRKKEKKFYYYYLIKFDVHKIEQKKKNFYFSIVFTIFLYKYNFIYINIR